VGLEGKLMYDMLDSQSTIVIHPLHILAAIVVYSLVVTLISTVALIVFVR